MPDAHDGPTAPDAEVADDVEVAALADAEAATVAAILDAAERAGGDIPLVDEAERRRLDGLADHGVRASGWYPVVAHIGEDGAGYGAVVVVDGHAVGDAGVAHDVGRRTAVLTALLEHLAATSTEAGAGTAQVWVRNIVPADLDAAAAAGYRLERRLAILGADLEVAATPTGPPPPTGITVRACEPVEDEDGIVAVLAAAYGTGPDGGWDLARFRERRQLDWFRADDLLVAVDADGRILGVHWLKRRSATVGEVYNLAVHPDAQGLRLGPVLLHAGLDHLAATGCDEVLLWVDRANDRAVRLYTSQGMVTRWEDVALGRTLTATDAAADRGDET